MKFLFTKLADKQRFLGGVFVLAFATLGTALVLSSHAATPTANLEAESGTVSSAASKVADVSASAGQAVKFGAAGSGITNGEQINASNTGLAGAGISESSLVNNGGGATYGSSFNGQTISGKLYTGTVDITGNNITLKNCKVYLGGLNSFGINISGDNVTVENCLIVAPAGKSFYEPVYINSGSDGAVVKRNDISRGDNLMTTYGTHVLITENYIHDVSLDSDPGDHPDGIEVYGGGPVTISFNRIEEDALYDAAINAAPYGSYTLTDMNITDNFLDGGQSHILLDNQNANGFIHNTRVLRNVMGGHTNPDTNGSFGIYHPLYNGGFPKVQTEAALQSNPSSILWPSSGADANHWGECSDLSPDKTGQIIP